MNDPHVEALLYRVEHSPSFNYENAQPCKRELPEFRIRIEDDEATVAPKEHFATAEGAREVVEPLLRAWELDAALTRDNPDVLRFVYRRAKIVDRNPTPGVMVMHAESGHFVLTGHEATLHLTLEYPAPPMGLAVEHMVAAMFDRWSRYKAGQALLGDTANFCRDALEKSAGGRQAAAARYSISIEVLKQLGKLATEKGGPHSRKSIGYDSPYTAIERAWLETVIRKLIRRAAEVAYDPDADRACITMGHPHLPRL
jgi:hypothetical protein